MPGVILQAGPVLCHLNALLYAVHADDCLNSLHGALPVLLRIVAMYGRQQKSQRKRQTSTNYTPGYHCDVAVTQYWQLHRDPTSFSKTPDTK